MGSSFDPRLLKNVGDNFHDLPDLTRNLDSFLLKYGYDQVNQLFIEKCSPRNSSASESLIGSIQSSYGLGTNSIPQQDLNVIQITHFVRSIRLHGYGIVYSSVNLIYQAMKKIINILSKQLSDESLRAILVKEFQRSSQSPVFTYERAERMSKRFQTRTGFIDRNRSNSKMRSVDLDSLRQTITQLGNSLALIRVLKNSALNCTSITAEYVPRIDYLSESSRFSRLAEQEMKILKYDRNEIKVAAKNLDECLSNLNQQFTPKTDYFGILIKLFKDIFGNVTKQATKQDRDSDGQSELQSDSPNVKVDHFKLFYIIIPSLTICYIDYIINCKDRVSARSTSGRVGALMSDDGFALGVAFLLTVMQQKDDFARCEWFQQVKQKLNDDMRDIEQRLNDTTFEESLKQISSMTLRRLNRLRDEYDVLAFTFNSAILFFECSKLSE